MTDKSLAALDTGGALEMPHYASLSSGEKQRLIDAMKSAMAAVEIPDISEEIRNRIVKADGDFFSNNNISEYIRNDDELIDLEIEVAGKMETVLRSLIIDIDNDHNTKDTARRVAKMFIRETFGGRYQQKPKITAFPNAAGYDGIYCTGPISIRSTCAHHLQNIVGKCYVGVKPGKDVIGLSKFNRIVHWIAERPQIQEEMTLQIADELQKITKSDDIAIVVKAEHHCMTHRGVKEHESDMTTAILRGGFKDVAMRDEFYRIIENMKG